MPRWIHWAVTTPPPSPPPLQQESFYFKIKVFKKWPCTKTRLCTVQSSAISSGQFSFYVLFIGTLWSFWPEETNCRDRDLWSLSETPPRSNKHGHSTKMAAQQELVSKFTPHISAQGVQRAGLKAAVSAEQVLKRPEPGNLGRKMLARERKGTASVRARDKLWRRTGRTGAVQRIHWLIYFWTSCWQPGPFAAHWDLIRFHVNRNSKETFEASHSKCVIIFRKNHWSFLQGKQIKRDVLVTKTLKVSYRETKGA